MHVKYLVLVVVFYILHNMRSYINDRSHINILINDVTSWEWLQTCDTGWIWTLLLSHVRQRLHPDVTKLPLCCWKMLYSETLLNRPQINSSHLLLPGCVSFVRNSQKFFWMKFFLKPSAIYETFDLKVAV